MDAGQLVPLEVVIDLIKEPMLQEISKARDKEGCWGFLIDGYPRELQQI
jgi:adenylate kinase family enzyme